MGVQNRFLKVNPETVLSVIADGYTQQLFDFADKGLDWLSNQAV